MTIRNFLFFLMSIILVSNVQIQSANSENYLAFAEIAKIHNSGITGKGYSVAIIDDGLDTGHPYFEGADIVEVKIKNDGNVVVGKGAVYSENRSHGTGSAGLIVGQLTNENRKVEQFGSRLPGGWAPGARLIFISFETSGANAAGQEKAFDWVTANYKKYNIVSLSLANWSYISREWLPDCGNKVFPYSWKAPIDALLSTPVALVVAGGNEGSLNTSIYPGCMPNAISVGSYADSNPQELANFTNLSNRYTTIVAPCCELSAAKDGWGPFSGTSSTAPIVASLFALANQVRPGITREEVISAMRATAIPLEEFGDVYPMLNISAFFQRLQDIRKIEIISNLKGALNKFSSSELPRPTVTVTALPSPAPTVTVTALPSPAPTVTVTAIPSENIQAFKDNISALATKIYLLEQELAALKKTTITCIKGKLTKKITAVNPVCPKGYKKNT